MQIVQDAPVDPLSSLLQRFSLRAGTFFNGELCADTRLYGTRTSGQLHLLRAGSLDLHRPGRQPITIEQPSLLFFPRPLPHQLRWRAETPAQLVCANLNFDGGEHNPLAAALPDELLVPLAALPGLSSHLDWICAEAQQQQPGQGAALDRLLELLVIQLLRRQIAQGDCSAPLLAGLADRHLAAALNAIHERPAQEWTLQQLAELAHMSRSRFAAHFQRTLGCTPGDYLLRWRIGLVQAGLRRKQRISLLAESVGYRSPAALARAFRRCVGQSPRDWLREQSGNRAD